jgi:hypothetical protein
MSDNHTVEDYKKYVRELKLKIKRLQDKNVELISTVSSMKSSTDKPEMKDKVGFAIKANNKITRVQVPPCNPRPSGEASPPGEPSSGNSPGYPKEKK